MSSSDVQVEASKDVWFRLFVPDVDKHEEQQSLPLIVYVHGGGFTSLSPDLKAYHNLCYCFAQHRLHEMLPRRRQHRRKHRAPHNRQSTEFRHRLRDSEPSRTTVTAAVLLRRRADGVGAPAEESYDAYSRRYG
nr:probable carboxylesterase 18 [Ipomoea trifida]